MTASNNIAGGVGQDNAPRDAIQDLLDHIGSPSDPRDWPSAQECISGVGINIGILRRARAAHAARLPAPADLSTLTREERVNLATVSAYESGLADGRREMAAEVDARVEALRSALEPFARAEIDVSGTAAIGITSADIIRAQDVLAALHPAQPTGGEA